MLISAPTFNLAETFGFEKAFEIIKEAGFDAFDMSLLCMMEDDNEFNQPDFEKTALKYREFAHQIGIICNQAHAPFPTSFGDERDEKIKEKVIRSMKVASIMGAKIIVVHPNQHLKYSEKREELEEMNTKFYKSLIPYTEEYGIKVALENMWQSVTYTGHITDSTCSQPREFCRYVDNINHKNFVACLDIGHAPLVGADLAEFIKALGSRLQALHVHDNNFLTDMHTLPFTQKIDFEKICKALGEIGYEGDITFEADKGFISSFPDEVKPAAERLMCSVGRYLAGEIAKNCQEIH